MVIIWEKPARLDLKNYAKHSKTLHPNSYILDLVNYTGSLAFSPNLGKKYYKIYDSEIRVLVYKMHRIYYYFKNNKIHIIKVAHSHMNEDTILQSLNKFLI